jgi:hypothetical protein
LVTSGENAPNHILVDLNIESHGDLLGDTRTAPRWIPMLHLDNRCYDFRARSFWARLLRLFESLPSRKVNEVPRTSRRNDAVLTILRSERLRDSVPALEPLLRMDSSRLQLLKMRRESYIRVRPYVCISDALFDGTMKKKPSIALVMGLALLMREKL